MCLTRKDKQYEIAKENITVYKVFYIRGNVLMSAFLFHEYTLGLNVDKEKEEWRQHGSLISLRGEAIDIEQALNIPSQYLEPLGT